MFAAALYAFCVLIPAAAAAVSGNAHCLTEKPVAAHVHQTAHAHDDGASHHHGNPHDHGAPQEPDGTSANCCGLFCISAMPSGDVAMLAAPQVRTHDVAGLTESLTGLGPDRLKRPPRP